MSLTELAEALAFRENYVDNVKEAANYIIGSDPSLFVKYEFGIVLGSGLGDLAFEIEPIRGLEKALTIDYKDIPHFPTTTVPGHDGKLFIGTLEGVPVIGLKGRKHYYEVADEPLNTGILKTVFPVHVLAELGIKNYFVTNAAGGLNPNYRVGDVMAIRTQINLLPNPLLGNPMDFERVDDSKPVWRFQPMNGAYDPEFRRMLLAGGAEHPGHFHEGVYIAVPGPSYETEGECIAFRDGFKADAVGMSTTNEVIVARNRGMKAVGMSCITNAIAKDGTNATNHDEVKAVLESPEVKGRLSSVVRNFFREYRKTLPD